MKLHLFYHAWLVNHWRDIVREHMQLIADSGLAAMATMHIGAIGSREDVAELASITAELSPRLTYHGNEPELFEFPTLDMLRAHCAATDGAVCYFHTKGVSCPENPTHVWWRDAMNDGVLRDWLRCVNALERGFDVTGCRFKLGTEELPYFAGNFWWATAEYIRQLPSISRDSRFEAEVWLFKGNPKEFNIPIDRSL